MEHGRCGTATRLSSLPELPRSNNLAVVTCAVLAVLVVPVVLGTPRLAIRALGEQPANRAWKNDAKVCAPAVGVTPTKTRVPHTTAPAIQ